MIEIKYLNNFFQQLTLTLLSINKTIRKIRKKKLFRNF